MSDNLISRQAVLDIIQDEWNLHIGYDSDIALGSVKNRVTALPIAYNKEAVVEQLEEESNKYCSPRHLDCEGCGYYALEEAIEIVKGDGDNE